MVFFWNFKVSMELQISVFLFCFVFATEWILSSVGLPKTYRSGKCLLPYLQSPSLDSMATPQGHLQKQATQREVS